MRKLLHSHLEMENHCFLGFTFYHLKPTEPKFSQLTGTWHTRTLIFTYFKRMINCPIFTKKHTKRHSPNCNPQTKSLTKHLQGKRKERGGDTGEATSGAQRRPRGGCGSAPLSRPQAWALPSFPAPSPPHRRPAGAPLVAPPEAPPRRRRQLLCLGLGRGRRGSCSPEATAAASRGGGGVGDGGGDPRRPSERGERCVTRRQRDSRPGETSRAYFCVFSPGPSPRAPHFPLQRLRRPLLGRAAVPARLKGAARRPERTCTRRRRRRSPPRFSWSLRGRRGLGPGRRARRCSGRSSLRWALGPGPGPAEHRALLTAAAGARPQPGRLQQPPGTAAPPAAACSPAPSSFVNLNDFFGLPPPPLRLRCRKADPATSQCPSPGESTLILFLPAGSPRASLLSGFHGWTFKFFPPLFFSPLDWKAPREALRLCPSWSVPHPRTLHLPPAGDGPAVTAAGAVPHAELVPSPTLPPSPLLSSVF